MTAPVNSTAQQGVNQVSADEFNTYIQFVQTVTQLRNFIPTQGPQHVYLEGITAPDDGGQGDFYWNSTSTGPDDGVNTIVPNGVTVGAWIRLAGGADNIVICTASVAGTVITLIPNSGQVVSNPPESGQIFVAIMAANYSGPFTIGVGPQTPAPLYDTGLAETQGQTSSLIENQFCMFGWNGSLGIFNLLNTVLSGGLPIGAEIDWPVAAVPSGFLLEYGQAVSRTSYPVLNAMFSAAGYPYGDGDGTTTFNLPDKRGRVVAGVDNMGGSAANLLTGAASTNPPSGTSTSCGGAVGNWGGEQSHTQTVGELVQHNHLTSFLGIKAGSDDQVHAGTNPAHAMGPQQTGNTGSGNPFNVVQPTIVQYKIIRAG